MKEQLVITWEEFLRDTRTLAQHLHTLYPLLKGIVGVARGGLIPAAIIARELDVRVIETVCVRSYDGTVVVGMDVTILKNAPISIRGDRDKWLIIDDLVDSGKTAKVVKAQFFNAVYATVYAKPDGEKYTDHFVQLIPQDTWIHFPWEIKHDHAQPILGKG